MGNESGNKQATNLLLFRSRDLPFAYATLLLLTTVTVCAAAWLWLANDGLVTTHRSTPQQISPKFKVDINRATSPEIANLPKVGPSLAQAIVAYREMHGPFACAEQLTRVSGIGEKKLAAIAPFLLPLPRNASNDHHASTKR